MGKDIGLGGLEGFRTTFRCAEIGAGERHWRFSAPMPFTAARSAGCHGGLRDFEIDADLGAPNMLWRYSLEKYPFAPCFQGFWAAQTYEKGIFNGQQRKSRHSVWLSDDVWREVDALYKLDNCPTRNEFVEKALRQYCGRLHAERSVAYLPRALQEMLEGTLGVFGDRLGKLLFKLVVEHNMTNHLLGGDIDMTRDEYNKMRGSSVREVSATHGTISFKDVLLFYQRE